MEQLFVPAIKAAGFKPVLPLSAGTEVIQARIVKQLAECDLVLCDLSANNPNVFFEMGVRTSLDLPIALVWDGLTELPFDTSSINTHKYGAALHLWEHEREMDALVRHISESADSCAGGNPMWKQFGVKIKAEEPHSDANPLEAKVEVLSQQVGALVNEQRHRAPTRATERFHIEDNPAGSITAHVFIDYVRGWAADNGRKVHAEESPLDYGIVEIRGLDGDRLTKKDVAYLKGVANDFGVKLIAHGSPDKPWDESVNYMLPDIVGPNRTV